MRSSILSGTAIAVAGAVIIMWGCGGGSSSPAAPSTGSTSNPSSGPTVTVSIINSVGAASFAPNPVPANAGDTVAFKNNDPANTHHIVLDDGSADLGDLASGQTSKSVSIKGTANFHCTIHTWMVGSIAGPLPDQPPCTGGPAYCD